MTDEPLLERDLKRIWVLITIHYEILYNQPLDEGIVNALVENDFIEPDYKKKLTEKGICYLKGIGELQHPETVRIWKMKGIKEAADEH